MAESEGDECILDGILASLEDIGCSGSLLESGHLKQAVNEGLQSAVYVDLCLSLCAELKRLNAMQESVSRPNGAEDLDSFQMEMRGFLQELACPHQQLTSDLNIMASYSTRLLLIDFLLSELLAARLNDLHSREGPEPMDTGQPSYSVPLNLTTILKVYGLSKPPAHVTVHQIFDRIIGKTKQLVSQLPPGHLTPGLVTQLLSDKQWATLDQINQTLSEEYSVRRKMLLTRCDVTVQSFRWSERAKAKDDAFSSTYHAARQRLIPVVHVSIARVLAAKGDLLNVEKTSSARERVSTQCDINKVLIGKVPDRGGRPRETRPPPEMPSFKQRTEPPQDQRRGGRGGGGGGRGGGWRGGGRGGGGRVQGGWSGGHGGRGGGGGGGWSHQHNYGNSYSSQGGGQQYYYS